MNRLRAASSLAWVTLGLGIMVACGSKPASEFSVALPRVKAEGDGGAPQVANRIAPRGPSMVPGFGRPCVLSAGALRCVDVGTGRENRNAAAAAAISEKLDSIAAYDAWPENACYVASGRAHCLGDNGRGQLGAVSGAARHDAWLPTAALGAVERVFVREEGACAIAGGDVYCWGANDRGQTGGDVNYLEEARSLVVPARVEGVSEVVELALAGDATCAVTRTGDVYGWGAGFTKEERGHDNRPVLLPNARGVGALASDRERICGVRAGRVVCLRGEPIAEELAAMSDVARVSSSSSVMCVATTRGNVFCAGYDTERLGLGDRSSADGTEFSPVRSVVGATDVLVDVSYACALTRTGELWCWGSVGGVRGVSPTRYLEGLR